MGEEAKGIDRETERLIKRYEGKLKRLLKRIEKGKTNGQLRVKRIKLDLESVIGHNAERLARTYCPDNPRLCKEAFEELLRRFIIDDVISLIEWIRRRGLNVEIAMAIYLTTRDLRRVYEYIEGNEISRDMAKRVSALLKGRKGRRWVGLFKWLRLRR